MSPTRRDSREHRTPRRSDARPPAARGARAAAALLLALLSAASGCDELPSALGGTDGISFEEFRARLERGTTRVHVRLREGSTVADRVVVRDDDERNDDERVESEVVSFRLRRPGTEARLTLAHGDLDVRVTGGTDLEADGFGRRDLTFRVFVRFLRDVLVSGGQPAVEAERVPPPSPGGAGDSVFRASEARLEDRTQEKLELRLNVDADNLEVAEDPPPRGWLEVLGLRIELRPDGGGTELRRR